MPDSRSEFDESERKHDGAIAVLIMLAVGILLVLFMVPLPAIRAIMPEPGTFSLLSQLTGLSVYLLQNLTLAIAVVLVSLAAALSYLWWRGDL